MLLMHISAPLTLILLMFTSKHVCNCCKMAKHQMVCLTKAARQYHKTSILKLTNPPPCMDLLLLNGVLLNHNSPRKDQLLLHSAQRRSGTVLLHKSAIPDYLRSSSTHMIREKASVHQLSTLPSDLPLLDKNP